MSLTVPPPPPLPTKTDVTDLNVMLEDLAPQAIEAYREMVMNPMAKPNAVKAGVVKDILDRVLGKATQRVEITTSTNEIISRIQRGRAGNSPLLNDTDEPIDV